MKKVIAGIAALVLISACGNDSGTGPNQNGNAGMSATIDGAPWSAEFAVNAINAAAGLYSITGFRSTGANNYTMVLSLYNITGPGTYPLGVAVNVFGGSGQLSKPPSSGWATPLTGAAGQINITTLTATRMIATFNFNTEPILSGSPGTPVVTNGSLNVPVTGSGGFANANQGGRITGTIGGPFQAAVVTGSYLISTGPNYTLTVVGNNNQRSITISIADVTAPGTYALHPGSPPRMIQVTGAPGNQTATWGSQGTGGSGSVEITSITASRVMGSFTATLAPIASGAAGNLVVSGTFEIPRLF